MSSWTHREQLSPQLPSSARRVAAALSPRPPRHLLSASVVVPQSTIPSYCMCNRIWNGTDGVSIAPNATDPWETIQPVLCETVKPTVVKIILSKLLTFLVCVDTNERIVSSPFRIAITSHACVHLLGIWPQNKFFSYWKMPYIPQNAMITMNVKTPDDKRHFKANKFK